MKHYTFKELTDHLLSIPNCYVRSRHIHAFDLHAYVNGHIEMINKLEMPTSQKNASKRALEIKRDVEEIYHASFDKDNIKPLGWREPRLKVIYPLLER